MALTTNQLIVGMFNAAAGGFKTNISTYISNMGANGVDAAANALLSQSPLGAQFLGQSLYGSNTAFSNAVVSSLLPGLSASTMASVNEAVTGFWALNPSLTRSQLVVKLIEAVVAIPATDPLLGSAASSFNAKVALADAYTGTSTDIAVLQTVVGTTPAAVTTYSLTTGVDTLVGSSGDDTFIARIQNNANTAQSGDKIDGGAGNDYLSADIGNSQNFAITLETTGVESVAIRAQAVANDSNNNNMVDPGNYGGQVQIDAQRMVGVTTWESNNSRADVVVEDVRILPAQITKDITIAFVESDPGQVDMGVYFDQLSLRNFSTSTSQLNLRVIDTYAAALGKAPLLDSPYGSFKFTATQNGIDTVVTLASKGMQDAQTYPELAAAIQAQLDLQFGAGNVTATVGSNFSVPDSVTSTLVTGQTIVITPKSGSAAITFSTPAGSGWLANDVVPAISGLHTSYDSAINSSTELVTSKIILDDVGRGSTGGDLVVGGLSTGETSSSLGVQRFEIEVRDNSKLQTINSTNNTLKEVTIVNGVTSSASSAYVTTVKDAGNLTVNGIVNAGDLAQNSPLPGTAAQHNAFGFSDVRLIDASAMTGKLAFNAEVTSASVAKYLNLTDLLSSPAADNVAFQYTGGSNNDTMTVVIDSAVAASRTLTGREDFSFTVDGGAGKDALTVDIGGNETSPWYFDQSMLRNITIKGGAGDDTIKTIGSGDFRVDAGSDNDTVYINNTGAGSYVGAQWIVAAANTDLTDLQGSSQAGVASQFLYKGTATITFSGAAAATAGGVTSGAAAALFNGFEKTVSIPTGDNYGVTQYHVNQAIKAAINSDPVLSKLLVAEDGPSTTLVIKSLVAGTFNANDLNIVIGGTTYATLPATEQTTVLNAFKAFASNSTATLANAQTAQDLTVVAKNAVEGVENAVGVGAVLGANGFNSTDVTDNIIDLGAGNDVLVLSTSAVANETLVYTGYGLGADSIVNFSTAGSSTDVLDFTAYLTGKASLSGSTGSQQTIKTTLNADNSVEANSVSVLKLTSTATQDFAGLNNSNLVAAINSTNVAGVANYAGLLATTLDAVNIYSTTNTLVGGIGKAVVLVENDLNLGEYKAFELTFNGLATNTTVDFTSAQLIANMDFGNSLTGLSLANLKGAVGALVTGAAGVPVVPAFSVSAPAAVAEGSSVTYTVTLSAAQAGATTVDYTLAGAGGATAADLGAGTALAGTLVFAPGATSATVVVPFAVDLLTPEAGEGFALTLANPSAGTAVGVAAATTAITNVAPVVPVGGPVAVAAAGASSAAGADFTYNVASGNYTYTVDSFAAGDKVAFFAGAILAIVPDADDTDGLQSYTATDAGTAAVTTITLTGLTNAQDAGIFNVSSFNTVFGAGSMA